MFFRSDLLAREPVGVGVVPVGASLLADGKVHAGAKETKYAITDGNTVSFYFDGSIPFTGKIAQDGSIVWGAFIYTKK